MSEQIKANNPGLNLRVSIIFVICRIQKSYFIYKLMYLAENKVVGIMKPGHCFTIEPMINQGMYEDIDY